MRPRSTRLVASLLLLLAPVLAGCATDDGGCGTRAAGGGPPVIATREQEMCEIARRRLIVYLRTVDRVTPDQLEDWRAAARRWTSFRRIDVLERALAADVGPELAASVVQGIAQVSERSQHPLASDDDPEAALVRAAAHGLANLIERLEVDDPRSDIDTLLDKDEFPSHLTD